MSEPSGPSQLNQKDIEDVLNIGAALAAEKDLDRLLKQILRKCRRCVRADAGSLFLAEGPSPDQPTHLRFVVAQNDSVPIELKEFTLPIDSKSLVGHVAITRSPLRIADVYEIPESEPFFFNREVDRKTGYRSKSLLSVPMMDHLDQLIGVVQLWNKKKDRKTKLAPETIDREVEEFTDSDHRLLTSLAAQAGIALENARLYADIENLFEGFIRASVTAIESRDPTTSGHSERVAVLTTSLAESIDRIETGRFSNDTFREEDLRQLNYAALLHDFGKIGVRESVLVKAKKLFPEEMAALRDRFDLFYRSIEFDIVCRKLEHLRNGGKEGDSTWNDLEIELKERLAELETFRDLILTSNEPSILPEGTPSELAEAAEFSVKRPDGSISTLLSDDQVFRLSVPKGSLSPDERAEIESHVTYTYEYLKRIPWTRGLRAIPEIAYAHHEKLDGTGYPRSVSMKNIPLPSKVMTVSDIFDALAASDRPYKKALPVPRALDILKAEANEGKLDVGLVDLFIEAKIYAKTSTKK